MLTLLTVRADDEFTCNDAPAVQRFVRTSERTPCVRQATRETLWCDVFCNNKSIKYTIYTLLKIYYRILAGEPLAATHQEGVQTDFKVQCSTDIM